MFPWDPVRVTNPLRQKPPPARRPPPTPRTSYCTPYSNTYRCTCRHIGKRRTEARIQYHHSLRVAFCLPISTRDIFLHFFPVWNDPRHEDLFSSSILAFLSQLNHRKYPRFRWCSRPYSRRYGSQTSGFSTDGSCLLYLFPGTSTTSVSPSPHVIHYPPFYYTLAPSIQYPPFRGIAGKSIIS